MSFDENKKNTCLFNKLATKSLSLKSASNNRWLLQR